MTHADCPELMGQLRSAEGECGVMSGPAGADEPEGWISREDYRRWAEGRPGRYERVDGRVVAIAPERVRHTRVKGEAFAALSAAVATAGLPCEVLVDGATIEVGESDYEPDVIVRCGPEEIDANGFTVPDPLIIVEVLSPTTRRTDVSQKLVDDFQLPSVLHYLILFADRMRGIHHRRVGDRIDTRIAHQGEIAFDPPGITVLLSDLYPSDATD
jgi:Uma2 family endonuclease